MIKASTLQAGDVILTYGQGRIWPPRYWFLWVIYRGIRKYQQAKWGPGSDYLPTHVRVALDPGFFEVTFPKSRFGYLIEIKGRYKVVRYRDALNENLMYKTAYELNGSPYDIGDIADFAVSGLLGWFTRNVRLFGDRAKKYVVCSTGAAEILRAGGASFGELQAIDPAYFVNTPESWHTIQEGSM